jgi:peptidoglycan-associated lipoprotein
MIKTSSWLAIAMASILFAACKGDAPRLSQRGEACNTTSDCAGSLACKPLGGGSGGVCVTGAFNVATTAKACVITCDSTRDCADGKNCDNGKCVQCSEDSECGSHEMCKDSFCVPEQVTTSCVSDSQCPDFERCQNGVCVESGCKNDRECVAATEHVDATCGSDGKCVVPCQTDLECGDPNEYRFVSCVNGQCTNVGCSDDKECELYFDKTSGNSGTSSGQKGRAACRDKGAK